MRNFKNGKFYYIENDELVDECFIDCMANMLTVIGRGVSVNIDLQKDCSIEGTFGKFWTEKEGKKTI